jgi:type IV secretory pathway VirB4 component
VLKGQMSGFVEYLYRTFRKNEGSVYLATQAISDLPQNVGEDMARVLIQNADTIYLMRRGTSKNYPDLQKWLSLTDFEVKMMKDLKKRDDEGYREFFLKQGEKASILRLESHDKTIAVYSSKGEDKERIKNMYMKTGNIDFALNQYTEDNILLNYLDGLYESKTISEKVYQSERTKILEKI